jgi:hypothetical protein
LFCFCFVLDHTTKISVQRFVDNFQDVIHSCGVRCTVQIAEKINEVRTKRHNALCHNAFNGHWLYVISPVSLEVTFINGHMIYVHQIWYVFYILAYLNTTVNVSLNEHSACVYGLRAGEVCGTHRKARQASQKQFQKWGRRYRKQVLFHLGSRE